MAYDGWIEYNGQELINIARTARLARTLGLDTVRIRSELIGRIEDRFFGDGFGLGGFGMMPYGLGGMGTEVYSDITKAPWYDAGYPASAEFAGIVPLSFQGLDDSTLTSTPTEYITSGGHSGKARNAILSLVVNVALVATTERGTEFGKRWMDRVLRGSGPAVFCTGADLSYLRYAADDAPIVHRRDVRLTRGSSVTRKKISSCSSTWIATFTLTAGDPFEYGVAAPQISTLGGPTVLGPQVVSQGSADLTEQTCPVYDYSPLFDPLFPALVESPTAPDFLPDGWGIEPDMGFRRKWARLNPFEPTDLSAVPLIALTSTEEARMVRLSIWPSDSAADDQCGALFTAIVTYLPADLPFYIDGEQEASYTWDGFSPAVRRTDSLVYGQDAAPIQWAVLNDPAGLLVTLDAFAVPGGGYQGGGHIRAEVQFIPKSD